LHLIFASSGIGLTAALQEAISVDCMLAMAIRQIPELGEFYDKLFDQLAERTSEEYLACAREKTKKTGQLHVPEFKLKKQLKDIKITNESKSAVKMIRFNFDKRVLQKEYFHTNFIPSFPFGTRIDECDIAYFIE
jgi:hypothetical protein